MSLNDALTALAGLAGYAALVTAIVNALKTFGAIKDGQATVVVSLLQVLGVVLVIVSGVFGFKLGEIDSVLALVSNLLVALTAIIAGVGWSKIWHYVFKAAKLPVVSKSFSV